MLDEGDGIAALTSPPGPSAHAPPWIPPGELCVMSLENPYHFKMDCASGTGLLEVDVSGTYIPC